MAGTSAKLLTEMTQPKKDFKKVYSEHRASFRLQGGERGKESARGTMGAEKSTSGVERDLLQLTLFPFILFLKYQLV